MNVRTRNFGKQGKEWHWE